MLTSRLKSLAAASPDAVAVTCGDRRLSYRQLVGEVDLLAGRLALAGVREGSAVVLALPNGIAFVSAFLALAATRAVAIPVPTSTTADELARYLDDFPAAFILSQQPFDAPYALAVGRGLPPVLCLDDLPDSAPSAPRQAFDGPVLCQYSSGSTGRPKRVVRHQKHLLAGSDSMAAAAAVSGADAIFCAIPLCHSHGLTNCLILALCNGARLVILEPRHSPDGRKELPLSLRRGEILRLIDGECVSILPGVPFLFALLAEGTGSERRGASLRLCFSAGSPLPRETFDRFGHRFGLPLRQLYGTTETGAVAMNLAPEVGDTWDSVGHPLPGCELLVDGRATGAAEGETALRCAAMCDGYAGQPDLGARHFAAGWFRPGDLARRDESGVLRITGRVREFIVSAGHKIDPAEVEGVLLGHPGVREAVVLGIAHPDVGELATAFVVLRPQAGIGETELAEHCRARLAAHKVPRAYRFLDQLPRTPLGKLSTHMLLSL